MLKNLSFFFVALSLFASLLFTGCTSSSATGTRFYVLDPLEDSSHILKDPEAKRLSIEVSSVRLPQYLERPQLVTRTSENQLKLAEFDQWGGNLRKNMMRVLAANLSQLLDTPHVAISSYYSSEVPDFRIDVEVLQFERDPQGKVHLTVQWRIARGESRQPVETRITELVSPAIADEKGYGATVRAMSGLLGDLSRMIAEAITNSVP